MKRLVCRTSWKRLLAFVSPPLLALLTAGWAHPLRPPSEGAAPEVLSAGSHYMGQQFRTRRAPGRDAIDINLADPQQHQFVMNRLRAAGKTQENSPRLFEWLRRAKERAQTRATRPEAPREAEPLAQTGEWDCTHFLVQNGQTQGGVHSFTSNPTAACVAGATYVYTDVVAYDMAVSGADSIVLASDAGEEYSGGTSFDAIAVHPTMPMRSGRKYVADSMMITVNELTGEEKTTFTLAETAAYVVQPTASMTHPQLAPGSGGKPLIETCQARYDSDCDYALVKDMNGTPASHADPDALKQGMAWRKSLNPWVGDMAHYFPLQAGTSYASSQVYVPTQFTYALGGDCTVVSVDAESKARLTKRLQQLGQGSTGGSCLSTASIVPQLESVFKGKGSGTFSYLLSLATATAIPDPPSTDCTNQAIINSSAVYNVRLTFVVRCPGEADAAVTYIFPRGGRKEIHVWNSCMAAGTQVARADGTRVPVEEVKVGDRVVANARGQVLTVTDVARGGEDKPMVRLRDSQGHEVLLTEQHPVILASGTPVQAAKLKVRDRVRTEGGVASLVAVERVPYEGGVFNLTLGTPAELEQVGLKGRTLFANGFLVGDNGMQKELKLHIPRPKDALAALPKSWHRDYLRRAGTAKAR